MKTLYVVTENEGRTHLMLIPLHTNPSGSYPRALCGVGPVWKSFFDIEENVCKNCARIEACG